jgi:hypothetical protein
MKPDTMTPTERELHHLHNAANHAYGGLDLRFEGGPWIAELDALVTKGWLDFHERDPGYMVGYVLSDAGRAVLAATSGAT